MAHFIAVESELMHELGAMRLRFLDTTIKEKRWVSCCGTA